MSRIRGEQHHKAKLTAKQVKEIRRRYFAKGSRLTLEDLAAQYGVNTSTISYIVTNSTWRHVK